MLLKLGAKLNIEPKLLLMPDIADVSNCGHPALTVISSNIDIQPWLLALMLVTGIVLLLSEIL